MLNEHDLVSHPAAVAAVSHSTAVAAVIHHLFLRSYKTSAASFRLAAAVYHRLCPHSSNLSAGSSFPTVSARACTKRARPHLYYKCEVPALRTLPLYIQNGLLKQRRDWDILVLIIPSSCIEITCLLLSELFECLCDNPPLFVYML